MLQYCDATIPVRPDTGTALAGSSQNYDDPSNDPKDAAKWDHQRDVRASLIRWLLADPDAVRLIDPVGVRVMGARILGPYLDLSSVTPRFGLALLRCTIPPLYLGGADLAYLDLSGSCVSGIDAGGVHVRGYVGMARGFRASGQVFFGDSRIDSDFDCTGGIFVHSQQTEDFFGAMERPALFLGSAHIGGGVLWLCCGLQADGTVVLHGATLNNLFAFGGRFINPGGAAMAADGADIRQSVFLGDWKFGGTQFAGMEADGFVSFNLAKVGADFHVEGAKFLGTAKQPHGLRAPASIGGAIFLKNLTLQDGAVLDLTGSSTTGLVDDEKSWPQPGKLLIDGFTYGGFYGDSPSDAGSRLRWIALQPRFNPGPYHELAQVLRSRGDDVGAAQVQIAQEDGRFRSYGLAGRLAGAMLRGTIGYGHRPMRALFWMIGVVLLGSVLVAIGSRAGIMCKTWPENRPSDAPGRYERLSPLLYSLDVFLPFVNLHQEHYWWPDAEASGDCAVLGRNVRISGSFLRGYLWLQVIAGWLLSAIFIAGITGLLRPD